MRKILVGSVTMTLVTGLAWMIAGGKAPEPDKPVIGTPRDISPASADAPPAVPLEPPPAVAEWMRGRQLQVDEKDAIGFFASHDGRVDALEWLKEQGVDAGATLMLSAAWSGRIEVMEWLKEQGAGVNVKDIHGETAMHRAAKNGRVDAMAWLKERGADVNVKDESGYTPLLYAEEMLERQQKEIHASAVKWLKANGAE